MTTDDVTHPMTSHYDVSLRRLRPRLNIGPSVRILATDCAGRDLICTRPSPHKRHSSGIRPPMMMKRRASARAGGMTQSVDRAVVESSTYALTFRHKHAAYVRTYTHTHVHTRTPPHVHTHARTYGGTLIHQRSSDVACVMIAKERFSRCYGYRSRPSGQCSCRHPSSASLNRRPPV